MKSIVTLLLIIWGTTVHSQMQFHVAPNGNDRNSGTLESPLASLTGARNAVRNYKKSHKITGTINIVIADGFYEMKEPLVLDPEDSGTVEYPVIYKAEENSRPIFSGGKSIKGFTVEENGTWKVTIPESAYYNWRFDQLFVNGKRAVMARTPNEGYLKIGEIKEYVWERGTGRAPTRAQQVLSFDNDNSEPIKQLTEADMQNARFRAYHKWDFTLRPIDKINKDSLQLFTSGEGMKPWNPLTKGGRIVFENYAAALDSPGEWYLNNKGTLYYIPLPGETPENTVVIAPVLGNLVSFEGDAAQATFVEHIRFDGITFSHSGFRMPTPGFEPNQAAVLANAAIMLKGTRDIKLIDCEISKTGQHALWFGKGCSDSEVSHCYLKDLGGGGIYLGDVAPLEGPEHTHDIRIYNNILQTGGRELPSAVGIWTGHSSDIEIAHNNISDFYYTGISVGWTWGYAPSLAKRNKITYNHIHHIGWTLLSDMAGVYTLGASEGTVVSNNIIDHIHAYSYGGWGLYTDEGSTGIVMENNLVFSTKTGGFHQHYGKDNIIRNNIFAFAKMYQIQATRVEDHRSFNFDHNIVIFDQGTVLQGPWNKINIQMDHNLYWNTKGNSYSFDGKSFEEWKQSGHDAHSFIADPYFINAEDFDFRLRHKKNIRKINFKPFDFSKAGVVGDEAWKHKSALPKKTTQAYDDAVKLNQ